MEIITNAYLLIKIKSFFLVLAVTPKAERSFLFTGHY